MEKTRENWADSKAVLKILFPDEKQDDISKYEEWLAGSGQSNGATSRDVVNYSVRVLGVTEKGKPCALSWEIKNLGSIFENGSIWFYEEQINYFKEFCIKIKQ